MIVITTATTAAAVCAVTVAFLIVCIVVVVTLVFLCIFGFISSNICFVKWQLFHCFILLNLRCKKKIKGIPCAGLEPATFGLEVQRAIHCASKAYFLNTKVTNKNWYQLPVQILNTVANQLMTHQLMTLLAPKPKLSTYETHQLMTLFAENPKNQLMRLF